MALAWREVYDGLRLSGQASVSDHQASTEDGATSAEPASLPMPEDEGATALTALAHPYEQGEQPSGIARSRQGAPFSDETEIGYRGPTACKAAGITYRQLDYWARTGLVEPSVRAAHGSPSQRLYGFRDILALKVVKRLLDTGLPLQAIRAAIQHLRDRGVEDLAQVTLMSDGVNVYECMSPNEVVDLLADGQGVFGIALGRVWQEVAGELVELPGIRANDGLPRWAPRTR